VADGFRQVVFFVFPSAAAFLTFGDLIVTLLFQRGDFGPDSAHVVTVILGVYAFGLVASSSIRLFASGFHAMLDTRTPLRYAVVAVTVGVLVGGGLLFRLRGAVEPGALAAAGLAAGGALGAWLNVALLWRGLRRRIGSLFSWADLRYVAGVGTACMPAGAAALVAETVLSPAVDRAATPGQAILLFAAAAAFGVVYWLATKALGVARPGWIPGPAPIPET
jgi:putative peptidoglycan lipid II flippase